MASAIDEQYVVDKEELAAIRAYDAAKASDDEAIPFEQAIKENALGERR